MSDAAMEAISDKAVALLVASRARAAPPDEAITRVRLIRGQDLSRGM